MERSIVIVGAGRAGSRAADVLRSEGFTGRVTLIGDEVHPPYDRPPLSKERLFGEEIDGAGQLYSREFFTEHNIDLRLGTSVSAIDRSGHVVKLTNGEGVHYDQLLIATGSASRQLAAPGHKLGNIATLRGLDDSRALAPLLEASRRLVVIGAGLIGLEVAAGAVARNHNVTVIEAALRPLMRAAPAEIAYAVLAAHRRRGVSFVFGASVEEFVGTGTVNAVRLADGTSVPADLVLVAIGGAPRVDLARQAGLETDGGIVTDSKLRTCDPDIFAAGDVASFEHPLFGRRLRLEHWQNAEEQGQHAALNLLGADAPVAATPWFWSDQYDLSLQGVGVTGDRRIIRSMVDGGLCIFELTADDHVLGATAFGQVGTVGRTIGIARRMTERRSQVSAAILTDPSVDLKKSLTEGVA